MIEIDVRLPLAHFELQVRCALEASVTAIVGRSGAGKTSLLEAIAGLRRASGRIVVDDVTLLGDGVDLPPERRRIGYVPQDAALFPHLSVLENVAFGAGDGKRRQAAALQSVLDTFELGALADRRPSSLSGGERQRVAIARALMTSPRLLLLDEPLAAVDQPLRERILVHLRRVRELGVPMVYVTHQPFEALALSTWCVAIDGGRVAAEGPTRVVLADPSVAGAVENVFEVDRPSHEPQSGITRVATSNGLELVLPYDQVAEAAFPLVVRIGADDIVVFGERPASISSRNLFEGTVTSMRSASGFVDLTISVPSPLHVRLTRAAADDLGIAPGARVWLALRSRAFRIVG